MEGAPGTCTVLSGLATFCLSILRQITEFFEASLCLAWKWTGGRLPGSHLLSDSPSEALLPAQVTAASGIVLTLWKNVLLLFFPGGEATPEISQCPQCYPGNTMEILKHACVHVCEHGRISISFPEKASFLFTAVCFPKYLLSGLPPVALRPPLPGEPEQGHHPHPAGAAEAQRAWMTRRKLWTLIPDPLPLTDLPR